MDSQTPLIEARGLTRRFGPNIAVDSLDLRLAPGEILGLLGPNGAGKSTTMKMLTGNLAPSQGEVLIKGQSLHEAAVQAKQQLGYLPERPPVYPELTVDEYLRYCAGLHGIPGPRRAEAVASSKRDCGLTEVGRRLIGNLSKGFQQRVGLAQAVQRGWGLRELRMETKTLEEIFVELTSGDVPAPPVPAAAAAEEAAA
jgi:ABC-2 type transport system ATP-binding protein